MVYQSSSDGVSSGNQEIPAWPVDYVVQHLGSSALPESALIGYLLQNAPGEWLSKWKLHGNSSGPTTNKAPLLAAYKVPASLFKKNILTFKSCLKTKILQCLCRFLHKNPPRVICPSIMIHLIALLLKIDGQERADGQSSLYE